MNYTRCLLVACLFTPGCLLNTGECTQSFVAGGLTVCVQREEPVDPAVVEAIVATTELEVGRWWPKVTGLAAMLESKGVTLTIVDQVLAYRCSQLNGIPGLYTCADQFSGANYGGAEIYVFSQGCVGWSALGHELMHSIEAFYLDGLTTNHSTEYLFGGSVEANINNASRALCPVE